MNDALGALLSQRAGIEIDTWRSFWDRLEAGRVDRTEAAAVLSSLATRFPDHGTVRNLLASFDERRPPVPRRWPGSVNVVGTGGGPKTFNVSTAAAFVAAAMGVPVVKTGSRAYTSSVGSIDLLERLGVRLTTSYQDTEDTLAKFGIAFAGQFVYPGMLGRLARTIVPMGMRPFGRFLNALGPFLAGLPVTAQVTGVSAAAPLADLALLAGTVTDRTIWLCTNDVGADELFGFTENVIHTNGGARFLLHPGELTAGTGALSDVESVATEQVVDHFLDVVSGVAGDTATETVCLNAAALAVASSQVADWTRAVSAAYEVVRGGAARLLVDRLRLSGGKRAAVVRAVA